MRAARLPLLLAAALLIGAMFACASLQPAPAVSNIRMATDDTGKTTTTTYSPGQQFYVFADLSGIKAGSVIQAKWYAVNAQGVDANSELNTSDYTYESGIGYVYFQLNTTDGSDWPTGSYRVDLYLDATKVGEQAFTVQ